MDEHFNPNPGPVVVPRGCQVCGQPKNPEHAWWWTAYGSTCSEPCARDLIREHEGGIIRPNRA